jgi:hypothetical protein
MMGSPRSGSAFVHMLSAFVNSLGKARGVSSGARKSVNCYFIWNQPRTPLGLGRAKRSA